MGNVWCGCCALGLGGRGGGGALTLLLEFLVLRLLQPRLRTDVVAAGLEEPGKDDRAADGAGVGDVLAVRAVEAALVAARLVNLRDEAVVGVLVAEGPLPTATTLAMSGITTLDRERLRPLTHMPGG